MMKDRTIVKAGEEKNMAVQSPSGILRWIIFKVKNVKLGTPGNCLKYREKKKPSKDPLGNYSPPEF